MKRKRNEFEIKRNIFKKERSLGLIKRKSGEGRHEIVGSARDEKEER